MKHLIICLATICGALGASAETLSPAQALARVNTSAETAAGARKIASRAVASPTPALTIATHGSEPEIYMFTPAEGGMMLVSAESETPALIGFSDRYTPGAELPPALEMMLGSYAEEIAALRLGNVVTTGSRADNEDYAPIEPICKTRWNQDAPYNQLCPMVGGRRSVTGCVATAMAQVLKVYEYPAGGSGGTYSYELNGENLSLNFDDVTFNWDAMADTYNSQSSDESKTAVAELMRAIGYAANMNYSADASGASSTRLAMGLTRNFGFDCTVGYYRRNWFTASEWKKMVYDILASGYPVFYDGLTPDGTQGHAFVVDGYKGDNFFHLNWGWGGMSDGYFLLSALDPGVQGIGGASAGFNAVQGIIANLVKGKTTNPEEAPLRFYTEGGFRAGVSKSKLGNTVSFVYVSNNAAYNCGPLTTSKVSSAVKFTDENGKATYAYEASRPWPNLAPLYGVYGPTLTIPTTLTDGTYTVSPAVYDYITDRYFDVYYPIGTGGTFKATVSGSDIEFMAAEKGNVTVTELSAPEAIACNNVFKLTATATNNTTEPYYGEVTARLYAAGMSASRAELGKVIVEVDPGETKTFTYDFVLTNNRLSAGAYEIGFVNRNGQSISERVAVTLSSELKATQALTCTDHARNHLTFSTSLSAIDGGFQGPVYIRLHERGNYDNYVEVFASEPFSIANGVTKEFTLTCDFSAGTPGARYTAYLYYNFGGVLKEVTGNKRITFTLGEDASINAITADDADADPEYYDLQGRRVAAPAGGIYIKRCGSTATKVRL